MRACVWGAKALRKNTHRTPPLNVERRRNGKPQTKRVLSGKSWFVRARVTRAREPASAVPRARTGALELWHRLALGFAHSRNKLGHTQEGAWAVLTTGCDTSLLAKTIYSEPRPHGNTQLWLQLCSKNAWLVVRL